jgi:preprotein translocase subunit SecG
MEILVLVLHVVAALGIVGLVLLQHGKGADAGAAFGSGASGSVFGSTGSANFLSRATAALAAVFFLTSLGLTYFSGTKSDGSKGVMGKEQPAVPDKKSLPSQIPPTIPAAPGPAAVPGAPEPGKDAGSKAQDVPK